MTSETSRADMGFLAFPASQGRLVQGVPQLHRSPLDHWWARNDGSTIEPAFSRLGHLHHGRMSNMLCDVETA
jgi:hypothetical protein